MAACTYNDWGPFNTNTLKFERMRDLTKKEGRKRAVGLRVACILTMRNTARIYPSRPHKTVSGNVVGTTGPLALHKN